MSISQKCQYALRSLFELAKKNRQGPIKIGDIAKAQYIPPRFLENILNEMKQAGFVESRRGKSGGYYLLRDPKDLSMGEIIRFVDGPFHPVDCLTDCPTDKCKFFGDCVFLPVWELVSTTVANIYDAVTLQDLIERDEARKNKKNFSYEI